jgi:hypothetical protein
VSSSPSPSSRTSAESFSVTTGCGRTLSRRLGGGGGTERPPAPPRGGGGIRPLPGANGGGGGVARTPELAALPSPFARRPGGGGGAERGSASGVRCRSSSTSSGIAFRALTVLIGSRSSKACNPVPSSPLGIPVPRPDARGTVAPSQRPFRPTCRYRVPKLHCYQEGASPEA